MSWLFHHLRSGLEHLVADRYHLVLLQAVRAFVTDSETSPSQNSPILPPVCTPPRQQQSVVAQVCLVTQPTKLPAPSQQLSVRRSPRLHQTSRRSVIMRTPTKWQPVNTSSASPHLKTSTPMQQDTNNEASTSGTMLTKNIFQTLLRLSSPVGGHLLTAFILIYG